MTLKRHKVLDREATDIHTVRKIGAKQALTPEGFLLCTDVPIKRTGEMQYGKNETPIEVGDNGVAYVTRDAAALFTDEAIASYNGKPVVNEHPDVDVNPSNWKKLAVGICLNTRRGTGADSDVMLGDLLITDAAAIRDVQAGKREVSAGYEADYEQTGKGQGRQTNIIGNHIALVERGRCGPRCAIGDHQPTSLKENSMGMKTTVSRRRIADKAVLAVRQIFRDAEEAAMEQLGNSGLPEGEGMGDGDQDVGDGSGDTHIHIHANGEPAAAEAAPGAEDGTMTQDDPMEARISAIEQTLGQIVQMLQGGGEEAAPADPNATADANPAPDPSEVPDGGGGADDGGDLDGEGMKESTQDRKMVGDSAALVTSYQSLISDAEVLYPGFRLPTFDSAANRKRTVDNMCAMRRSVLNSVYLTADGKTLLDTVAGTADVSIDKLDCNATASLFRSAAGAKRLVNNRTATADGHRLPALLQAPPTGAPSIAQMNAQNKAYWAGRNSPKK